MQKKSFNTAWEKSNNINDSNKPARGTQIDLLERLTGERVSVDERNAPSAAVWAQIQSLVAINWSKANTLCFAYGMPAARLLELPNADVDVCITKCKELFAARGKDTNWKTMPLHGYDADSLRV